MAILMTRDSKLRMVFEVGTNEEGKPVFKAKSYSNVAEGATPDGIKQVAQALASLSNYPMSNIQQSELHEIL